MGLYDNSGKLGDKNLDPEWGTYVLADQQSAITAGPDIRPFIYRNQHEIAGNFTAQVRHGADYRELPGRADAALDADTLQTVEASMARWGMVGLLALHRGEVVYEAYRGGNTDQSRSIIHSCTKSLTSTLIASAIQAGLVSLDGRVAEYIPELAGSDYGASTIRSLMDMSSGVNDGLLGSDEDETERFKRRTGAYSDPEPSAVIEWAKTQTRFAEPSAEFEYYDFNYFLLAETLRRVYGKSYERILEEQIWVPAGMQHDAVARVTAAGDADGHGGLMATLRDMGRIGLFVLDAVQGSGGPRVPEGWFETIAAHGADTEGVRAPGQLPMSAGFGYSLGWWPHPETSLDGTLTNVRCISAQGVFGQCIFVFPDRDAVVVAQSASMMHDGDCYGGTLATAATILAAVGA